MNMDFNADRRMTARAEGQGRGSLDWHGLRARLAATYAAGMALAEAGKREAEHAEASFEGRCARTLAVYRKGQLAGLGAVNPTALGNGKPNENNDATVAGTHQAGDRGKK